MSAACRFALLEWAAQQKAWILEDDYDGEFRYVSRPVAALPGMDARDRVIYIGTLSKALVPGVRLGYVVVPRRSDYWTQPASWARYCASQFDRTAPATPDSSFLAP